MGEAVSSMEALHDFVEQHGMMAGMALAAGMAGMRWWRPCRACLLPVDAEGMPAGMPAFARGPGGMYYHHDFLQNVDDLPQLLQAVRSGQAPDLVVDPLSGNFLDEADVEAVAEAVAEAAGLQVVDVAGHQLRDGSVARLLAACSSTCLRAIDVGANCLAGETIAALAGLLQRQAQPCTVAADSAGLDDASLLALWPAVAAGCVSALSLAHNDLGAASVSALASALADPHCRLDVLCLNGNKNVWQDGKGVALCAKRLVRFDVCGTGATDDDVSRIFETPCPRLS